MFSSYGSFSELLYQTKIIYFYPVVFLKLASVQKHSFNDSHLALFCRSVNITRIEWVGLCMICGQIWQSHKGSNRHLLGLGIINL